MATQNITNFSRPRTLLESEDVEDAEDTYLDETLGFTQEEKAYIRFIRSKSKAKKKWNR